MSKGHACRDIHANHKDIPCSRPDRKLLCLYVVVSKYESVHPRPHPHSFYHMHTCTQNKYPHPTCYMHTLNSPRLIGFLGMYWIHGQNWLRHFIILSSTANFCVMPHPCRHFRRITASNQLILSQPPLEPRGAKDNIDAISLYLFLYPKPIHGTFLHIYNILYSVEIVIGNL